MQNELEITYSELQKDFWQKYWKNVDINEYRNETLRRQLKTLKNLDRAVLPRDELIRVCIYKSFAPLLLFVIVVVLLFFT